MENLLLSGFQNTISIHCYYLRLKAWVQRDVAGTSLLQRDSGKQILGLSSLAYKKGGNAKMLSVVPGSVGPLLFFSLPPGFTIRMK